MRAMLRTRSRLAAITGIAVLSLLVGSTATWAYWTSQASATVSSSSAQLTVATADFGSVTATVANEALTRTGTVTVTNSTSTASTQAGQVTLTFSATGGDGHRGNFRFAVWDQAVAACDVATLPSLEVSGGWDTGGSFTADFTPGQSRSYCVRTTSQRATGTWPSSGTVTFQPRVDAQIALGNYRGDASGTATLTTQHLYPLHTPTATAQAWYYIHGWDDGGGEHCLDYYNAQARVGGWPCKDSGTRNQAWRFVAVASNPGYFVIRTNQGATGPVMQATGSEVLVTGAVANQASQQWTLQRAAAGFANSGYSRPYYQIVNRATGQCLTKPSASGLTSMANCDGGADQRYVVVRALFSGTNGSTPTVSCTYDGAGTFLVTVTGGAPTMRYELRVDGDYIIGGATDGSGSMSRDFGWDTAGLPLPNGTAVPFELFEDVGPNTDHANDPGTRVAAGTISRGATSATGACSLSGMG